LFSYSDHGLFGKDGSLPNLKSLRTLFNRWSSEKWGEILCLVGAVIGPSSGPAPVYDTLVVGLMDQSNMIAQEVETYGVRTFSAKEMAFNILGLMPPILFSITQVEPVSGDLSGPFDRIADLADVATRVRANINEKAELRPALKSPPTASTKALKNPQIWQEFQRRFSICQA
jgi:fatty acid synthase subunit alpha, fungi type